jgi:tetratricopeptide (TPR) repeat protein
MMTRGHRGLARKGTMTVETTDTIILDPPPTNEDASPQTQEFVQRMIEDSQKRARTSSMAAQQIANMGMAAHALRLLHRTVNATNDGKERARCYFVAGIIRERTGQFEAASRCYAAVAEDLLERAEGYLALNNLGYCLNRLGRHAEAEQICRRAIATDSKPFNAHKNLGVALERLGRLAEAADEYLAAAKTSERDDRPLRHLRVLIANHPELESERPAIAEQVEALIESERKRRGLEARPRAGQSPADIRSHLRGILVTDPIHCDEFHVFGLCWDQSKSLDYGTLDQALAAGTVTVSEVNDAGSVPRLLVNNQSDRAVFLMAGEQLIGAKQNRVINTSFLVGARTEFPMPVTCVEQGRWSYRSRGFRTSGTSSHHTLRLMMTKQVHSAYKTKGRADSDQMAVWHEVARKLSHFGEKSPSRALHDAYESVEERLKRFHDDLTPGENWSGAVFCFGDSIVGADLFDKPSTLRLLWPKLVRAYAFDSLEGERCGGVDRSAVEEWLSGLSRTAVDSFPSVGLGTDVRLEGDRLVGAMLLVDEVPVHVQVFSDEND